MAGPSLPPIPAPAPGIVFQNNPTCPNNSLYGEWVTADIPYPLPTVGLAIDSSSAGKRHNFNRALYHTVYGYENGKRRSCIKKPMLFVEGIDFGLLAGDGKTIITGADLVFTRCGGLGFVDFWDRYEYSYDGKRNGTMTADHPFYLVKQMIEDLNQDGYDFIYLDFEKGAGLIQENAMVVVKMLEMLNKWKAQNGSCEKTVLAGASMGALITRYAATFMEHHNIDHNIRVWASFDGPQLGANIPIGFQNMAAYLGDQFFLNPILRQNLTEVSKRTLNYKLNTEGARQLLCYHYASGGLPDPLRVQLLSELIDMGNYPSLCRKFAISNGSGTGSRTGLAQQTGQQILDLELTMEQVVRHVITLPIKKKTKSWFFNMLFGSLINTVLEHTFFITTKTKILDVNIYAEQNAANAITCEGSRNKSTSLYKTTTIPAFDDVPGCHRSDVRDLAAHTNSLAASLLKVFINNKFVDWFTFMPTVSTLGLKEPYATNYLKQSISGLLPNINAQQQSTAITNFDMLFYPDTNEQHVRVSDKNKLWFKDNLNAPVNNLAGNLTKTIPFYSSTSFNHTVQYGHTIYNLEVEPSGFYHINKKTKGGYDITGIQIAGSGTHQVYTTPCSIINVKGLFTIGDQSGTGPASKATLTLTNGSIMHLFSSSTLFISDSSALIIEFGAKLIIAKDAYTHLLASNAVIVNRGTIELEEGAIFSLKPYNDGNNNGRLILENTIDYKNAILFAKNSTIYFKGKDTTNIVLEIKQPVFNIPETCLDAYFASCQIDYVNFGSFGTKISTSAPTTVLNVFCNGNSMKGSCALESFGQNGVQVRNCFIYDFLTGLASLKYNNANNVELSNTTFSQCTYGLVSNGAGFNIKNCNLSYCRKYGWLAQTLQTNCLVQNTAFNNNYGPAIDVTGNNFAEITFKENQFNNNIDIAILLSQIRGNFRCNLFSGNNLAIYAGYDSRINLSTNQGNGFNTFQSLNNTEIELDHAKELVLDNGYNDFLKNLSASCSQYGNSCPKLIIGTLKMINCNYLHIAANNNAWPFTQLRNFNNLFNIKVSSLTSLNCHNSIVRLSRTALLSSITCGKIIKNVGGPSVNSPNRIRCNDCNPIETIDHCPTCEKLTTGKYAGKRTNEAVEMILEEYDTINPSVNIDNYAEVLNQNYITTSQENSSVLDYALYEMSRELSKQLQNSTNEIALAQDLSKTEQATAKRLMLQPDLDEFYNKMQKAQLKRVNHNTASTISEMSSLTPLAVIEQNEVMEKWQCPLITELSVIDGSLTKQQYLDELFKCENTGNKRLIKLNENIADRYETEMNSLTPNPANEEVNYFDQVIEKEIRLTLIDATGRSLIESQEPKLNLTGIASGIYFVQIRIGIELIKTEKLIKK